MFRYLTAGESHGKGLTIIVEGLPAGLRVDLARVNSELSRRQEGHGRSERMQIESDQVVVLSGLRYGETIGSPVTMHIPNRDWKNHRRTMATEPLPRGTLKPAPMTVPRPGHADLAGWFKYGRPDLRDVWERSSARETAARTAAGSLARIFLENFGVGVGSHTVRVGKAGMTDPDVVTLDQIRAIPRRSKFRCFDPDMEQAMAAQVDRAKSAGDSLGGVFQVVVDGVPPGLGHFSSREKGLDALLAGALMSIPSAKGVEIGRGVRDILAGVSGRNFHDPISIDHRQQWFNRGRNRAGGLEGGLTNGAEIRLTVYLKPIPTLGDPLPSVDIRSGISRPAESPRADVCVVPAAGVVGEALVLLVLADVYCSTFGGETLEESLANFRAHEKRLRDMLAGIPVVSTGGGTTPDLPPAIPAGEPESGETGTGTEEPAEPRAAAEPGVAADRSIPSDPEVPAVEEGTETDPHST